MSLGFYGRQIILQEAALLVALSAGIEYHWFVFGVFNRSVRGIFLRENWGEL